MKVTILAIHDLYDGELLSSLSQCLPDALHGSEDATRVYVAAYRRLTDALLEQGRTLCPDRIVETPAGLTFCDARGRPAIALTDVLESLSVEAPFTSWTLQLPVAEAVAVHLVNRMREMLSCPLLTEPSEPPEVEDDLAAQRFIRWVRFHLNRPDAANPLRRVMEALELSKTETASLFGVSRQAIGQWVADGVPTERQEKLATLLALCDLLERKLKADRLPGIARRPAEVYGGLTMLELVAEDRHNELLALASPRELRVADRSLTRRTAFGLSVRRGGPYNRLAEPGWADPLDISDTHARGVVMTYRTPFADWYFA